MKPNFPIILNYNNFLDLIPKEDNLNRASLLGVLKGNLNSEAYDNEGNLWELKLHSEKVKNNFIIRLLAHRIYNPKLNVSPEWKMIGKYNLVELKSLIKKFVQKDEDIFTQFVDAKTLNNYIQKAETPKEVYQVLLKYVFEFDGE